VRKIRVVVANQPRLMRELILATISEQSDIEVVGEADQEAEIMQLVERTRPDFLIIGSEDREKRPGLCGFLLARYPEMRVLAVAAERDHSVFYWAFGDIRSKTVETSEEGILGALRVSSAC
jgi:chemotaxis response regulator CheB